MDNNIFPDVPIHYQSKFVVDPQQVFDTLWNELAWVHRENTPRIEYYCNDFGTPYTYGHGQGARTYEAQPYHSLITGIRKSIEGFTKTAFEVCFLNGYRDGSDQLGWHADDSPEMDDKRPIAIVSLGAEREIYFKKQGSGVGAAVVGNNEVSKLWLGSGSLCIMKPGMQDTHYHRIPKSSVNKCGPRISLTFRGYSTNE